MPRILFPGTTIQAGSKDKNSVLAIQKALNKIGCGPIDEDGDFGAATFNAVETFQARSVDSMGVPLTVDGKVGPTTWSVLFGDTSVPVVKKSAAATPLLLRTLSIASTQVGVMESPKGSNRGPEVDEYIRTTGLNPASGSFAWCACFIYWCFDKASKSVGVTNPDPKTAGVLDLWNKAGAVASARRILPSEAMTQPSLVVPGALFLLRTSSTTGHVGIVESVQGNKLTTIEGNTNDGGSREGIGVYRRTTRTIPQVSLGFILFN